MSNYDNTNKGVLFKNDRRESDNHPHYTGKINIGGQEKRLAAWLKEGQKGKFMSLQISEYQEKQAAPQPAQQPDPQQQMPSL